MSHEEKKIVKIVGELTMYFFAMGADEIQSGITKEDNMAVISFKSNYHPDCRDKLHSLHDYLNDQKNDGIEDIYWELAGVGDPGETSQLLLLGMMIDKAEIVIEDDYVNLKLYKEIVE